MDFDPKASNRLVEEREDWTDGHIRSEVDLKTKEWVGWEEGTGGDEDGGKMEET